MPGAVPQIPADDGKQMKCFAGMSKHDDDQTREPGPSCAPLGQQNRCWPARCNARRPRIQNLTVFRPPSESEGRPEKLG